MRMTIETTGQVEQLDGVPVRVWRGRTEGGVACLLFVHRIAVEDGADASQFERELVEQPRPDRIVDLTNVKWQGQ